VIFEYVAVITSEPTAEEADKGIMHDNRNVKFFYYLTDFTLVCLVYFVWFSKGIFRKVTVFSWIIILAVFFGEVLTKGSFFQFYTTSTTVSNILMILIAALSFIRLLKVGDRRLTKEPMFYFGGGVLMYYAVTLLVFPTLNTLFGGDYDSRMLSLGYNMIQTANIFIKLMVSITIFKIWQSSTLYT
jgi:hypothetical protein